jgi:hypothetical protein
LIAAGFYWPIPPQNPRFLPENSLFRARARAGAQMED